MIFTDGSNNKLNFDFPTGLCINGRFQKKHQAAADTFPMSASHTNKSFIQKKPLSFKKYKQKFLKVIEQQMAGNNYLLNLCAGTTISITDSLKNIYEQSSGLYKYYFKNKLLCFSPESFIQIQNNTIQTCPMKGTIRNERSTSLKELLDDPKEKAEHIAITDLLRNDLNMVSTDVQVVKYRYPSYIKNRSGELIQTSTLIRGTCKKTGKIISALYYTDYSPQDPLQEYPRSGPNA